MKLDKKNIKDKIKIALDAVEDEKEPYRTAAFQVIFSKLLEEENIFSTDESAPKHLQHRKTETQVVPEVDKQILEKIDVNKLPYMKSLKSVHDQCLALLAYVSKNVREQSGLTSDEMKEIFAEKFGLTTITVNNISMSLKNVTGKYVTRKEITVKTLKTKIKKYRYEILQKGMEYIESKIAKNQPAR